MILSAIASKLKSRSKDDFKGRHSEAGLIVQAVSWYLRYPLSYRDIEELLLERGLEVDHSTVNRWVLAYAPLIERRLRPFRSPTAGRCASTPASRRHAGVGGVVAGIGGMNVMPLPPLDVQAMRMELGRPRSSMRLRTWTATSTSVARRSSVCDLRASPITLLKRDMAVSARARLV